MKQSQKITLCGLTAALATVIMLTAWFPYFTYASPALAGLVLMVPVIELNCRYGVAAYLVSCVAVFLFAEPESRLLYIFFFGYYLIVKALIERMHRLWAEWLCKLAVFNAAMLLIYGVLSLLTDLSVEEFGVLGKYGAWLFLAAGNLIFVLYDIGISRITGLYFVRIHPQIEKMFRH